MQDGTGKTGEESTPAGREVPCRAQQQKGKISSPTWQQGATPGEAANQQPPHALPLSSPMGFLFPLRKSLLVSWTCLWSRVPWWPVQSRYPSPHTLGWAG